MPTLPPPMLAVLAPFAPLFSARVWRHAQVLLAGALLAPAQRTVTAALRAVGASQLAQFHRYHRVLSHAQWSGLAVGRVLGRLLVDTFAPEGPLVFGLDETIERRRGAKIAAKGIYRDAVRSSRSQLVKTSGLRWVCLMLLVPIPFAARTWALPLLTALAPRHAMTPAAAASTRPSPTGPGNCCSPCAAGGRTAPSSWWPTAPTPRWTSSPPAPPGTRRSPS